MHCFSVLIFAYYIIPKGELYGKKVNSLYGQLIIFITLLFYFLFSGDPLALFVSLWALVMVILFVFETKNYNPKLYYMAPVPIFVFQALILTYTYLFRSKSLQDPLYAILFYFLGAVYILTMFFYFYFYPKKF